MSVVSTDTLSGDTVPGDTVDVDELIGLDDLLGPEPARHRLAGRASVVGGTRRWALRSVLAAVAFGSALWGMARLAGVMVPYPLPVFAMFVIGVVFRVLRSVPVVPLRLVFEPLRADGAAFDGGTADGLSSAVRVWDANLERAGKERARFASTVQARLCVIVDERLRLRYGVSRGTDPAHAKAIVGEELWKLLHVPFRRTPAPRDLAALVTRVERL